MTHFLQMDANSSHLSGDLLLTWDNGNQQRERDLLLFSIHYHFSDYFGALACDSRIIRVCTLTALWIPGSQAFSRHQGTSQSQVGSVEQWRLCFLTQRLMQNKYSVNSCWTNEHITLLSSWISLYSSLIIHLFLHPFVQPTHIMIVPWNFAWVKQEESDCLYQLRGTQSLGKELRLCISQLLPQWCCVIMQL